MNRIILIISVLFLRTYAPAQHIEGDSSPVHIKMTYTQPAVVTWPDSTHLTLGIGYLPDERPVNEFREPTLRVFLALDKFSKENPVNFPFHVTLSDSPAGLDYYITCILRRWQKNLPS
jgi:hypothetical protein